MVLLSHEEDFAGHAVRGVWQIVPLILSMKYCQRNPFNMGVECTLSAAFSVCDPT